MTLTEVLSETFRHSEPPEISVGKVRRVDLGAGRRLNVRLVRPPVAGAPTVLLLHGWTATADVNFSTLYRPLSERCAVIAPDHRGHGRGIRSDEPFTLRACADDAADLLEHLGTGPAVVLGYSMGGPVALLMARHRPEAVQGVVLCATAAHFGHNAAGRVALGAVGAIGRATKQAMAFVASRGDIAGEVSNGIYRHLHTPLGHDLAQVAEAGGELARFDATSWLHTLDVPAAVVVTTDDHAVPPLDQHMLRAALPGAIGFEVPGDHDICLQESSEFVSTVCAAVGSVSTSGKRLTAPRNAATTIL
ncbi:MAG: alpha/beta fold hydrolase [Acidimicrobiales bacterium]